MTVYSGNYDTFYFHCILAQYLVWITLVCGIPSETAAGPAPDGVYGILSTPTKNFQHRYWDKPIAPPLSTPTQHSLWAITMSTQNCCTECDMEVVHDCNWNSAVVETPTTWRLLNLLTSYITASDWLQKIHDTSACALTLPSCQMKNDYYERSQLTTFGPFLPRDAYA